MEFNIHFLLSKNTKATSRGNKNKSDLCILSVFVFIFLYMYICICVYIYIYIYIPQSRSQGFLLFLMLDDSEIRYQKGKNPGIRGCIPQPPNRSPHKKLFGKYKPIDLFSGFYGLIRSGKSD